MASLARSLRLGCLGLQTPPPLSLLLSALQFQSDSEKAAFSRVPPYFLAWHLALLWRWRSREEADE